MTEKISHSEYFYFLSYFVEELEYVHCLFLVFKAITVTLYFKERDKNDFTFYIDKFLRNQCETHPQLSVGRCFWMGEVYFFFAVLFDAFDCYQLPVSAVLLLIVVCVMVFHLDDGSGDGGCTVRNHRMTPDKTHIAVGYARLCVTIVCVLVSRQHCDMTLHPHRSHR